MVPTALATACGCVLFTDLVGFTEFNDAVGDAEALAVLESQTELATAVIETFEARIVKELGDGLMIWFDCAEQGLAGAAGLLTAFERSRAERRFPLAVRMGLHHGNVTPRGDDLIGQTVNIAARVSALAGPGELLVSEAALTADPEARPVGRLHPVGPVQVKGIHEPIWLHRLSV